MTISTLKRILVFALFCLAQALVFNRIQLFGCATPLLYVYFVIMFPRNFPKWSILLWSFTLGLVIDMFTNTPGVATSSLTAIAAIQPYLLELFLPHDAEEGMEASAKDMGWEKFITYSAICVFIFCLLFFTFDSLNMLNLGFWLQCVIGSTILTLLLTITLENIRK